MSRLFTPSAVTIIGASPKSVATERLLGNLRREDFAFPGKINLVNPAHKELFGIECVAAPGDVAEPGLVYLMVRAERCLGALEGLSKRPDGVVVYADGFSESGRSDLQDELARWAARNDIPLLGPQSTGIYIACANLVGIAAPIPERVITGRAALVSQSGGMLGSIFRECMARGIGLSHGIAFGNGASTHFGGITADLLREADVDMVLAYAESIASLEDVQMIRAAREEFDKPVILTLAGRSESGHRVAASHTGALAAATDVITGLAEQHGVIVVDTIEDMLAAAEALRDTNYQRAKPADVGVIAHSGGSAILLADALTDAGIPLYEPRFEASGRGVEGVSANPLDVGARVAGDAATLDRITGSFVGDPAYGIIVNIASMGLPADSMPHHLRSFRQFAEIAKLAGKVGVIAAPIEQRTSELVDIDGITYGHGVRDTAAKVSALRAWADTTGKVADEGRVRPGRRRTGRGISSEPDAAVISGELVSEYLDSLPVKWPATVSVRDAAELATAAHSLPAYPVVAKVEGIAHRMLNGALASGINSDESLSLFGAYLVSRFGHLPNFEISVSEQIEHQSEYIVGFHRDPDWGPLIMFGVGGSTVGAVSFRSAPLRSSELRSLVSKYIRDAAASVAVQRVIAHLETALLEQGWIESAELNPITLNFNQEVVVLDAKIYRSQNTNLPDRASPPEQEALHVP